MSNTQTTNARGAIACGHPATAAAAQEILHDGGNAFDAALAAFAAACVAEPVLASLGGGGFLLAQPADGRACLYDFFTQTPLRRLDGCDFYPIYADFGTATQEFHIGLGSIATPGAVKGIFTIHAELGSLPLPRLFAPAIRLAREGVPLREVDAYLFRVVGPILLAKPEARALFTRDGDQLLGVGDRTRQPQLADAMEALAAEGEALFYRGEMAERLATLCAEHGGHLSRADLAAYAVAKRPPLERSYRGTRILTNPPPSAGGILIAFALGLLTRHDLAGLGHHGDAALNLLCRVMATTNRARVEAELHEGGGEAADLETRFLDPALLERYAQEVETAPPATRGTTHISVIDNHGNAAALSLSNGEGCGSLLPGTGIMLNNMLGEEDLNPKGFNAWPEGSRMSSMMSPTLTFGADGTQAVLGSGGSNRIRTAILQVLLNFIDFRQGVAAAVEAPRLHYENGIANLEGGLPEFAVPALGGECHEAVRWPRHNLFFGGVHAVARDGEGRFSSAGDPRRGGASLVVD